MTNDELEALDAIKQLKARYCRFIDTKDWDGFQGLWLSDSVLDATSDAEVQTRASGVKPTEAELASFVAVGDKRIRFLAETNLGTLDAPKVQSCHYAFMPELELTSPTTARGIWSQQDELKWLNDRGPIKTLHGYGWYHETYQRVDGRWYIKTMKLIRHRLDVA